MVQRAADGGGNTSRSSGLNRGIRPFAVGFAVGARYSAGVLLHPVRLFPRGKGEQRWYREFSSPSANFTDWQRAIFLSFAAKQREDM